MTGIAKAIGADNAEAWAASLDAHLQDILAAS